MTSPLGLASKSQPLAADVCHLWSLEPMRSPHQGRESLQTTQNLFPPLALQRAACAAQQRIGVLLICQTTGLCEGRPRDVQAKWPQWVPSAVTQRTRPTA